MQLYTPSSPHIHSGSSVSQLMHRVLLALIPGYVMYVALFGWGVVANLMIAVLTAYACETLMLLLRKRPLAPFLSDHSALVTASLLAISLPPLAPWWIVVIGIAFAIIIAKHLYGGLGYNPFNPAMVGYVVLLVSFPRELTTWAGPQEINNVSIGIADAIHISIFGTLGSGAGIDTVTMATPLDHLKTEISRGQSISDIIPASPIFGNLGGNGWEWISLAFLAGGLWLLYKKVIQWYIPVSMLTALVLISTVFHLIDPERYADPVFHLVTGATILGAFFIATDPITASTTEKGRLIYGAGIGILVYIIRTWGGYPDGVAFGVLLMNILAPTLDYYTQPRPYGERKG
ncbi:MAG: electron transport complex subunit RsxD [Pseudomonadota bacterium]